VTLEAEAFKARGVSAPPAPRPTTGVDRFVRGIALIILFAALSALFWVPFHLLGSIGAAVVLAGVTLLAANLASRVHKLRQRLDLLEARIVELPAAPESPPDEPRPDQK